MSLKKLVVVFIVVTVDYCACNKKEAMFQLEPSLADKMCPQHKVEFQAISRGVLDCAQLCTAHSRCQAIIFHHGNKTCFGINEQSSFSENMSMPGARFYRPPPPRCDESIPLVEPLPDAQFSASTVFDNEYAAHRARLSDTHCWSPYRNTQSPQDYLQVELLEPRVVTSIITRGDSSFPYWVKTYKVSFSNDCLNFMVFTDGSGKEKIFEGNVDRSSDAVNDIEPPVVTRCLRIQAVTWEGRSISLRLEAMGCLAIST